MSETNADKADEMLKETQSALIDLDIKQITKGDIPEIGVGVQLLAMGVTAAQVRATLAVADQLGRIADVLERVDGAQIYLVGDRNTPRVVLA